MSSGVLARAVVVLSGDDSELDKALSDAERKMQKVGESLGKIGATLTSRLTLPLLGIGALAAKEFGESADAIARMDAVLRASGGAAGVTADHIKELASQLAKVTTFQDNVTISAASMLLTFQNVRNEVGQGNDIFDRTIKVSQDLAALMGGDLQDAVLAVGRALEDPENGLQALRRAHVQLTQAEKDHIKALLDQGRTLEAQKFMLDKIEGSIKGTAVAMAQTPTGKFKQAWNEVKKALEEVGHILVETISPAIDKLKGLALAFQDSEHSTKVFITALATLGAAAGPILYSIELLQKLFEGFKYIVGLSLLGVIKEAGAFISLAFSAKTAADAIALLKMAQGALAGALVLGAIAAVGVTIAKFLEMKEQVAQVARSVEEAAKKIDESLAKSSAKQAAAISARLTGIIQSQQQRITEINKEIADKRKMINDLAIKGVPGYAQQGFFDQITALEEERAALAENVNAYARQLAVVNQVIQAAKQQGTVVRQNVFDTKAATDAIKKYNEQLYVNKQLEELMKDKFDEHNAAAEANEEVIKALVAAHVPLESIIPGVGKSLRQLTADMLHHRQIVDALEESQKRMNDIYDRARQAVEAARTPQQIYTDTVGDLMIALQDGKITWDEYVAGVKHAAEAMDDTKDKAHELKQALHDMTGRAVDDFIDFVFEANKSWKEFATEMLRDIAKLILKLEIMKFLFGKGTKEDHGILGGILGFASGGFLGPGEVGLVGEQGPELISGGHSGVTVTPLTSSNMSSAAVAGDGMAPMILNFNVSSIDSRDSVRFFEENEGMLSGLMLRAWQRSAVLRRRFGG